MQKLYDLSLLYIPGEYSYEQRVRGTQNYSHTSGNVHYNGWGGKQTFVGSRLFLYGIDEENKEVQIPIKQQILQTFNREKITQGFADKVEKSLPDEVTVCKQSDGTYSLSRESCRTIYRAIHPRKKFYI